MFKQIAAIIILVTTEWGFAYWFLWHSTTENASQWFLAVAIIILAILNGIVLHLYTKGKIEEIAKEQ